METICRLRKVNNLRQYESVKSTGIKRQMIGGVVEMRKAAN